MLLAALLHVKWGLTNLGQWGRVLRMNVSHWLGLGMLAIYMGEITGDKLT